MEMVPVERIQKPRRLTLNPELVRNLLIAGARSPSGESNLSRIIGLAIEECVWGGYRREMEQGISVSRKTARVKWKR